MWTKPDDELIAQGIRELCKLGLVDDPASVETGFVVRMPKAYPVYDEHYQANVSTLRKWLEVNTPNVYPCGRNGMHKYNNQDHSMFTAMLSVENIFGAQHDVWSVNVEAEYHEHTSEEPRRARPVAMPRCSRAVRSTRPPRRVPPPLPRTPPAAGSPAVTRPWPHPTRVISRRGGSCLHSPPSRCSRSRSASRSSSSSTRRFPRSVMRARTTCWPSSSRTAGAISGPSTTCCSTCTVRRRSTHRSSRCCSRCRRAWVCTRWSSNASSWPSSGPERWRWSGCWVAGSRAAPSA